ncbi:MAG: hypothetical protein E6J90_46545 [Deltaproteobacteria bacterium]|nr:MAG: hypothetical protein E6J91_44070 [Deltaproteobacteria bacterium]TMQ06380.1 MAG: hypothetical protein E6J90_46545 [Deltaproteobacteria bacterium]
MSNFRQFYDHRNQATRIDLFEELTDHSLAALRSFTRRLGAPHLLEEVILPKLREGDSQLLTAVQDRPWPPWGLGARFVTAVCQTHAISDASYAVSPVYVTDEDLTNVGMISAVFKEALDQLAVNPRAEVCYLVAENSTLVNHVLTQSGFKRSDDVFVTWAGRYHTYRALAGDVLKHFGLDKHSVPDLLAHDLDTSLLEKNALFHQTLYLGSRAEWASERTISEIIGLVRGAHASKPGGVPSGSGRFAFDPERDIFFDWVANFLGGGATGPTSPVNRLLDYVVHHEKDFKPATIVERNAAAPSVNEKIRRALTLDKLGEFEATLVEHIKSQLQGVLQRLKRKPFALGRIEMQITASGDGSYFKMHQDSDGKDTRELSFVYFFHREPRRFSGGELRIFESRMVDGKLLPADHSHTLAPRQDAIVFFPPLNEHEVLPVRVPSGQFGDNRFTINGWIHRQ